MSFTSLPVDLHATPEQIIRWFVGRWQMETTFQEARVSFSSVKRYTRITREGDYLTPKKSPERLPKIDEKARNLLEEDVKWRPLRDGAGKPLASFVYPASKFMRSREGVS